MNRTEYGKRGKAHPKLEVEFEKVQLEDLGPSDDLVERRMNEMQGYAVEREVNATKVYEQRQRAKL